MTTEEIKKYCYKNNPTANFSRALKGNLYYTVQVGEEFVAFIVPIADMGDATFSAEMPAKLLLRYLVKE